MISLSKEPRIQAKRLRCRKKFLYYFKKGFYDPTYLDWERNYKWQAHQEWEQQLSREEFADMLTRRAFQEIALRAVRIETRTNLLFSFEKMALRDAVRSELGAKSFAIGLFDFVYGNQPLTSRFERFTNVLGNLPRKQTRVLTWPLQTVFGFIARPKEHLFLKPRVTRLAAEKYGYPFRYHSRPNVDTYLDLLAFAKTIRSDNSDLRPRDHIDLQSFIWVLGSDEYPD